MSDANGTPHEVCRYGRRARACRLCSIWRPGDQPDGPFLFRYRQDQSRRDPLTGSISVYDRPAAPDVPVYPFDISDREEICTPARRGNVEKKKPNSVRVNKDKFLLPTRKVPTSLPLCRLMCQNANKVEYHWHRDCPRNSSTSSTSSMSKKAKNVTFEELEEDE